MTTAVSPRTSSSSANAGQIRRLTRNLTADIFQTMAWSAVGGVVVTLVGWLFSEWSGGRVGITVEGDHVHTTWFGITLVVALIAAFVQAIIMGAGFSRVPIAMGATRRNITIANLITTAIATITLGLAAFVVYLLESTFNLEMTERLFDAMGVDPGLGDVAIAVLIGTVGVFAGLLFGLAVGVVFVRFHWLVGVIALVLIFVVIPIAAEHFRWGWYDWFSTFGVIQGLIHTALAGAAYILMMRRLKVP
ncbi:MAG TPA: hypothetical protein VFC82_04330 [Actinomycetaceae bacterium]|nr:hypothetical protein [Actinomycetaceae bacterium]